MSVDLLDPKSGEMVSVHNWSEWEVNSPAFHIRNGEITITWVEYPTKPSTYILYLMNEKKYLLLTPHDIKVPPLIKESEAVKIINDPNTKRCWWSAVYIPPLFGVSATRT